MDKINIPKNLIREMNNAAKNFGVSKDDFLLSAVLYYLKSIKERIELKKELEQWERISDADLIKFEDKI